MKKIIAIIATIMCIASLSACSSREDKSTSQDSSSETAESRESTGESSSTVDGSSNDTMEPEESHEKFIDVSMDKYEMYALTNQGNVYKYYLDGGALELIDENSIDIDAFNYNITIVYADGSAMTSFFHNDFKDVVSASGYTLLREGGIVEYYYNDQWNKLDMIATKVVATYRQALILDTDNTLWICEFDDGSLEEISKNVIDFDYSISNELYYSNDIWYITSDNKIHIKPSVPQNVLEIKEDPPQFATKIDGNGGYYLAQQKDTSYIYGNVQKKISKKNIPIKGVSEDVHYNTYAIIDEEGVIHYHSEAWSMPGLMDDEPEINLKIKLPE